ncbi:MAG: rod-determining factor RdfA, partial [Halodesulfurarchaeum sp.]
AAWTGPKDERASLRDLAARINRAIIERALERSGAHPLAGEIETIYQALTGEADGATERDVRGRLDRLDVDLEALEDDLVSYQAVRTYLRSVRGLSYESEPVDPVHASQERIQRLRGRLRAVTVDQLEALSDRGAIDYEDGRVLVQVQVYCEECGRQFDVEELLELGGCACSE